MPQASTTGADANGGAAKSREHNQGNQDRSYTLEQKQAVIRIRRCSPTAFYDILGLEEVKTTVTDTEIKKAYRKLSLLTHPDKNGHEHADEAFKMVSRAFGVLSDPDKKSKFDRFGGDPDSRFGGGAPAQNPFAGFNGRPQARAGGAGGPMWEEDISPEEMFRQFFGGGGMGGGFGPFGGGMFDTGPGFVFNMGGGPGIRIHQFGGPRVRRRPPTEAGAAETPRSLGSMLASLLPLLILFVLPLLSSLFSGGSTSQGPQMRFTGPEPPYTEHRLTPEYKIDYYVNPADVSNYTPRSFSQLDVLAEQTYITQLRAECEAQVDRQQRLINEAQGWFFQDENKMNRARAVDLSACNRIETLRKNRARSRSNY